MTHPITSFSGGNASRLHGNRIAFYVVIDKQLTRAYPVYVSIYISKLLDRIIKHMTMMMCVYQDVAPLKFITNFYIVIYGFLLVF